MSTVTQSGREFLPIKSAGSNPPYSVSFLKITKDGDRIRVSPTRLGKHKLPRFWTVWLEDLILKKTKPEQQFHISIAKNHVLIGADGVITPEGFHATIHQLVAQIHSVDFVPIAPRSNNHRQGGMARSYSWRVLPPLGRLKIARLQALLPKEARVAVRFGDELRLTYSGVLPLPQHVKLQVEYFAFLTSTPGKNVSTSQ